MEQSFFFIKGRGVKKIYYVHFSHRRLKRKKKQILAFFYLFS